MNRPKVFFLFPAFVLLVFILGIFQLGGLVVHYKPLPSHASVKAVGVGVFWDLACTNECTQIDWGLIEPGENKTVTLFIMGTGNAPVTLSMFTESWVPVNASDYLFVTWSLEGASLDPGQILPGDMNLHCEASVTGITNFTFIIVIVGSG